MREIPDCRCTPWFNQEAIRVADCPDFGGVPKVLGLMMGAIFTHHSEPRATDQSDIRLPLGALRATPSGRLSTSPGQVALGARFASSGSRPRLQQFLIDSR